MLIDLVSDAVSKIKLSRIYSLSTKDKSILNETFDKLQTKENLTYSTKAISFDYSVFVA